jgi:NADH-quinone oxidoreductase subunit G
MGGNPIEEAIGKLKGKQADTVIILEADLFRVLDSVSAEELLSARQVIIIDHTAHATSSWTGKALVLPAAAFAEADGTLVNNEGRAQRFYRVFIPEGQIQESWRWLKQMIKYGGGKSSGRGNWENYDDIVSDLAARLPVFGPIRDIAPPAGFRVAGMKIPRQPHRWSGRTAITANLSVHEPRPPEDPDTPLAFTMEGVCESFAPPPLVPRFWAPGWNSPQALNKFQQEVGGPLRGGDPGVRLIEPRKEALQPYRREAPQSFKPRAVTESGGRFFFVAAHYVFGSEELSALAPGVHALSPAAHLLLNPGDAKKLNAAAGAEVAVEINEAVYTLPVRLEETLAEGIAAIPARFPGLGGTALPAWGRVLPAPPARHGAD